MFNFVAFQILACALIAGFAVRFSGKRDIRAFLVVLVGIWLSASVLLSIDEFTPRSALATSLWCLSIAAIYAAVPGILVGAGKPPAKILISSFLALTVQIPLSFYSALYIGCYVGHSCP